MEEITFNQYKEQIITLDFGLTIHYFPYPSFHTTSMGFVVPYGNNMSLYSINGKRVKTGIAHFLEHRMFDAGDDDFSSLFSKVGATSNAYTYFDKTVYYFSTSYDPMEAFKILFRQINEFHSTEKRIKKERKIIIQERLEEISEPISTLNQKTYKTLFNHSTIKDPIIGYKEDIESTTYEDLYSAYSAFYDLKNMSLVVIGPVDINLVIDYINKNYKERENKYVLRKVESDEDYSINKFKTVYCKRDIVKRINALTYKVNINHLKEKYGEARYEVIASFALGLLFDIGSPFLEEFNKLDVSYNSLSYSYFDVDGDGVLSLRYLASSSKEADKLIKDSLTNPINYIDERGLELYKRREYGKKLMSLQDPFSVFYDATLNLSKEASFLKVYTLDTSTITIEDIEYFIKYIGKGIMIRGVLNPKEGN